MWPVAEVARDLGINAYTLHNWVKADREAAARTRAAR
ncbi:terminase gpP N-terminus-related DNA-binding protein [Streptomyces prunicolor]